MLIKQTTAVTTRVLRQLAHDRRFVALSLVVPLVVIYMLWIFFDAAEIPFFDVNAFVPSVSAFIVHFITYVLCAIVLVRERSQQTLTRMFVSGYQRTSIIAGYLVAYSLLATVQSLIVLLALNVMFGLHYAPGTFLALYGVIWLLAVISIALGIFISNFARNEGQVFPFIPLILMPSVFFSGMLLPVSDLPGWAQWLRVVTPMYYANEGIQAIIGTGSIAFVLGLVIYGVVVLGLAVTTLRESV
ncbi:MAG: ABC transporter permease [Chloroflexota bacterium]